MFIPDEVLKEIKYKLDIVEVVRDYIHSLKKVGKNWVCLCPFHNDHNPSMRISQDLGIFKCFSCGEGGDIFGFVQKIENISFVESVKLLAKKAGIELNLQAGDLSGSFKQREELLQFNNRLVRLFQHFLLERREGSEALKYLVNRGITKEIIENFKLGYAPKDFKKILNVFHKKGFNDDFLLTAGIVSRGERGLKPLFYDRVIFPIFSQNNECVGFGGRALNNDVMPKYINTPETLLYKKSRSLYGINNAKKYIREQKRVYLVEGYMDVIACHKNGIMNAVAPCGTAVTAGQIALLGRYTEELVLFLDADSAGIKGAEKALKEASNSLLKKYVLVLKEGKDPDEYFKNHTIEDFKALENDLLDGFDFLVKTRTENIDKRDYTVLMNSLNSIFEFIALEDNEIIQNSMVERLAGLLNIDKRSVAREYLNYKNKFRLKGGRLYDEETAKNGISEGEKVNIGILILDNSLKREIDLILMLLFLENARDLIKKTFLHERQFLNDFTQNLFKKIFFENLSVDKKNFIGLFDYNLIKKYIENRLFSEEFRASETVLYNNAVDRIIDLIKRHFKRQNQAINEKIKLGELYQDDELVKKLQEEKSVIINDII